MGHSKGADGLYHINGETFELLYGSRAQVMHGTAYKTSGGLTRADLVQNKNGRIVSRSKHNFEKKSKRLLKHGYGTKKGHFGFVRIGHGHKSRSHRRHGRRHRGGTTSVMNTANMGNLLSGLKAGLGNHATSSHTSQAAAPSPSTAATSHSTSSVKHGGNCGLMKGGYNGPNASYASVKAPYTIQGVVPGNWGPQQRALYAAAGGGRKHKGGYVGPLAPETGLNSAYSTQNMGGHGITSPQARALNAAVGGGKMYKGGYAPPSASYAGVNTPYMIKGVVPEVVTPQLSALRAGY